MNVNEFARYTTTYEDVMPRIAIECLVASHNISTEGVMDHLSPFFQSLANKLKRLSINQITRNKGEIGDLRNQLHNQTNYTGDRVEIESKHCNEMFEWFTTGNTIEFSHVLKACANTRVMCELFESSVIAIANSHIKADDNLKRINKPFESHLAAFNKSPNNIIPHGYKLNFFTQEIPGKDFDGIEGLFSISIDKIHSRQSGGYKTIIDKADFHKLDSYIDYFEKINNVFNKDLEKFTWTILQQFLQIDKDLKDMDAVDRNKIKKELFNGLLIVCMGYQMVPIFVHTMVACLAAYHKLYLKHGI